MILIYDIDSAGGSWQYLHARKEGAGEAFRVREMINAKHPVNCACSTGKLTQMGRGWAK